MTIHAFIIFFVPCGEKLEIIIFHSDYFDTGGNSIHAFGYIIQ